jgi:plasmid stability protein
MTSEQEKRIAIETEFVRIALEVEAEHGGQIFVDRSPHCSMWSARVFWPKWVDTQKGGVCEQVSFHSILNYAAPDGGRSDLDEVRAILTQAVHKLRDREGVARTAQINALRIQLSKLEQEEPGDA